VRRIPLSPQKKRNDQPLAGIFIYSSVQNLFCKADGNKNKAERSEVISFHLTNPTKGSAELIPQQRAKLVLQSGWK